MENWKEVVGYEGLYEVSDEGNVRSLVNNKQNTRRVPKVMRLKKVSKTSNYAFMDVTLRKDGKNRTFRVHRLVGEAFVPNPDSLPFINHKDEDPLNNKADNLEWCTQKYNNNYGHYQEHMSMVMKGKMINRIDQSKVVRHVGIDGITYFPSVSEAHRLTGIPQQTLSARCNKCLFGFSFV